MRLMAQPRKMPSMSGFDLEITGFVSPGRAGLGLHKLGADALTDIVAYSSRIPVKSDRKS
jgi:hypothetical protein